MRYRTARAIPCIHRIRLRETAKPEKMIQYLSKVVCQPLLIDLLGKHLKILILSFAKKHIIFINVLSPPKFGIPPVYAVYRRIRHWYVLAFAMCFSFIGFNVFDYESMTFLGAYMFGCERHFRHRISYQPVVCGNETPLK